MSELLGGLIQGQQITDEERARIEKEKEKLRKAKSAGGLKSLETLIQESQFNERELEVEKQYYRPDRTDYDEYQEMRNRYGIKDDEAVDPNAPDVIDLNTDSILQKYLRNQFEDTDTTFGIPPTEDEIQRNVEEWDRRVQESNAAVTQMNIDFRNNKFNAEGLVDLTRKNLGEQSDWFQEDEVGKYDDWPDTWKPNPTNNILEKISKYSGKQDEFIKRLETDAPKQLRSFVEEFVSKNGKLPEADDIEKEVEHRFKRHNYDMMAEDGLVPKIIDGLDREIEDLLISGKFLEASGDEKSAYLMNKISFTYPQYTNQQKQQLYNQLNTIYRQPNINIVVAKEQSRDIKSRVKIYSTGGLDIINPESSAKLAPSADYLNKKFGTTTKESQIQELIEDIKNNSAKSPSAYGMTDDSYAYIKSTVTDPKAQERLQKVLKFANDAANTNYENEKSWWQNVFGGLGGGGVFDALSIAPIASIEEARAISDIALKMKDNEELSFSDQTMIDSYNALNTVNAYKQDNLWYNAGRHMIPESLRFIADFYITVGAGKAAFQASEAMLYRVLPAAARTTIVGKGAVQAVSSTISHFAVRTPIGRVDDIFAEVAQKMIPYQYSQYFDAETQKIYKEIGYDENSDTVFNSAFKAYLSNGVESMTESIGEVVGNALKSSTLFNDLWKVHANELSSALGLTAKLETNVARKLLDFIALAPEHINRLYLNTLYTFARKNLNLPLPKNVSFDDFFGWLSGKGSNFMRQAGIQSLPLEYMEEFISNRITPIIYGTEDKFWSSPLEAIKSEFIETAISLAPIIGGSHIIKLPHYVQSSRLFGSENMKILDSVSFLARHYNSEEWAKNYADLVKLSNRIDSDALKKKAQKILELRSKFEAGDFGLENTKFSSFYKNSYLKNDKKANTIKRRIIEGKITTDAELEMAMSRNGLITSDVEGEYVENLREELQLRQNYEAQFRTDRSFAFKYPEYSMYKSHQNARMYTIAENLQSFVNGETFIADIDAAERMIREIPMTQKGKEYLKNLVNLAKIKMKVFKDSSVMFTPEDFSQGLDIGDALRIYEEDGTTYVRTQDGITEFSSSTADAKAISEIIKSSIRSIRMESIPAITSAIQKSSYSNKDKTTIIASLVVSAMNTVMEEFDAIDSMNYKGIASILYAIQSNELTSLPKLNKKINTFIKAAFKNGLTSGNLNLDDATSIVSSLSSLTSFVTAETMKRLRTDLSIAKNKTVDEGGAIIEDLSKDVDVNIEGDEEVKFNILQMKLDMMTIKSSSDVRKLAKKNPKVAELIEYIDELIDNGVLRRTEANAILRAIGSINASMFDKFNGVKQHDSTSFAYIEESPIESERRVIKLPSIETLVLEKSRNNNAPAKILWGIAEEIAHYADHRYRMYAASENITEEEAAEIFGQSKNKVFEEIYKAFNSLVPADINDLGELQGVVDAAIQSKAPVEAALRRQISDDDIRRASVRIKKFVDAGYDITSAIYYSVDQQEFFARFLADTVLSGVLYKSMGRSKILKLAFASARRFFEDNVMFPLSSVIASEPIFRKDERYKITEIPAILFSTSVNPAVTGDFIDKLEELSKDSPIKSFFSTDPEGNIVLIGQDTTDSADTVERRAFMMNPSLEYSSAGILGMSDFVSNGIDLENADNILMTTLVKTIGIDYFSIIVGDSLYTYSSKAAESFQELIDDGVIGFNNSVPSISHLVALAANEAKVEPNEIIHQMYSSLFGAFVNGTPRFFVPFVYALEQALNGTNILFTFEYDKHNFERIRKAFILKLSQSDLSEFFSNPDNIESTPYLSNGLPFSDFFEELKGDIYDSKVVEEFLSVVTSLTALISNRVPTNSLETLKFSHLASVSSVLFGSVSSVLENVKTQSGKEKYTDRLRAALLQSTQISRDIYLSHGASGKIVNAIESAIEYTTDKPVFSSTLDIIKFVFSDYISNSLFAIKSGIDTFSNTNNYLDLKTEASYLKFLYQDSGEHLYEKHKLGLAEFMDSVADHLAKLGLTNSVQIPLNDIVTMVYILTNSEYKDMPVAGTLVNALSPLSNKFTFQSELMKRLMNDSYSNGAFDAGKYLTWGDIIKARNGYGKDFMRLSDKSLFNESLPTDPLQQEVINRFIEDTGARYIGSHFAFDNKVHTFSIGGIFFNTMFILERVGSFAITNKFGTKLLNTFTAGGIKIEAFCEPIDTYVEGFNKDSDIYDRIFDTAQRMLAREVFSYPSLSSFEAIDEEGYKGVLSNYISWHGISVSPKLYEVGELEYSKGTAGLYNYTKSLGEIIRVTRSDGSSFMVSARSLRDISVMLHIVPDLRSFGDEITYAAYLDSIKTEQTEVDEIGFPKIFWRADSHAGSQSGFELDRNLRLPQLESGARNTYLFDDPHNAILWINQGRDSSVEFVLGNRFSFGGSYEKAINELLTVKEGLGAFKNVYASILNTKVHKIYSNNNNLPFEGQIRNAAWVVANSLGKYALGLMNSNNDGSIGSHNQYAVANGAKNIKVLGSDEDYSLFKKYAAKEKLKVERNAFLTFDSNGNEIIHYPRPEEVLYNDKVPDYVKRVLLGKEKVLHGAHDKFTAFNDSKLGMSSGAASASLGHFVTTSHDIAGGYASIRNRMLGEYNKMLNSASAMIYELTGLSANDISRLSADEIFNLNKEHGLELLTLVERFDEITKEIGLFNKELMDDRNIVSDMSDEKRLKEIEKLEKRSGYINEFYLNIRNPKIINLNGASPVESPFTPLISDAKRSGYDSVVLLNARDGSTPQSFDKEGIVVVGFSSEVFSDRPLEDHDVSEISDPRQKFLELKRNSFVTFTPGVFRTKGSKGHLINDDIVVRTALNAIENLGVKNAYDLFSGSGVISNFLMNKDNRGFKVHQNFIKYKARLANKYKTNEDFRQDVSDIYNMLRGLSLSGEYATGAVFRAEALKRIKEFKTKTEGNDAGLFVMNLVTMYGDEPDSIDKTYVNKNSFPKHYGDKLEFSIKNSGSDSFFNGAGFERLFGDNITSRNGWDIKGITDSFVIIDPPYYNLNRYKKIHDKKNPSTVQERVDVITNLKNLGNSVIYFDAEPVNNTEFSNLIDELRLGTVYYTGGQYEYGGEDYREFMFVTEDIHNDISKSLPNQLSKFNPATGKGFVIDRVKSFEEVVEREAYIPSWGSNPDIGGFIQMVKAVEAAGGMVGIAEVNKFIDDVASGAIVIPDANQYVREVARFYRWYFMKTNTPKGKLNLDKSTIESLISIPVRKNVADYKKDVNDSLKVLSDANYRKLYSLAKTELVKARRRSRKNMQDDADFYSEIQKLAKVNPRIFQTSAELEYFIDMLRSKPGVVSVNTLERYADDSLKQSIDEYGRADYTAPSYLGVPEVDVEDLKQSIRDKVFSNYGALDLNNQDIRDFLSLDLDQISYRHLTEYEEHLSKILADGVMNRAGVSFTLRMKAAEFTNKVKENRFDFYISLLNKKAARSRTKDMMLGLIGGHGNIKMYNLIDIFDLVDSDMQGKYDGLFYNTIAAPLERTLAIHEKAVTDVLERIAPPESLRTRGAMNFLGVFRLLHQTPDFELTNKLATHLNDELGTDYFKKYMTLNLNSANAIEAEGYWLLHDIFMRYIEESVIMTMGAAHEILDEDGNRIYSDEVQKELLGQMEMASGYDSSSLKNKAKDFIKHARSKGLAFDSVSDLVRQIKEGSEADLLTDDERRYIYRVEQVMNDVRFGHYTDGLTLDYASSVYSGRKFVVINGYTPVIRYRDFYSALDSEDMTRIHGVDFQYKVSTDFAINDSFLESRKNIVSALETNLHKVIQMRADQQLFYLLNARHGMFIEKLFAPDMGLVNSADSRTGFNTPASYLIKGLISNHFRRGFTPGKLALRKSGVGREIDDKMSNMKALYTGVVYKAPGQLTAMVNSMQGMKGSPAKKVADLMFGINMTLQYYFKKSFKVFLENVSPEIYNRGFGDATLDADYKDSLIQKYKYSIADARKDARWKEANVNTFRLFALATTVFLDKFAAVASFFATYKNFLEAEGQSFDMSSPNLDIAFKATRAVIDTQSTDEPFYRTASQQGIGIGSVDDINSTRFEESAIGELARRSFYSFLSFSVTDVRRTMKNRRQIGRGFRDGNAREIVAGLENMVYNFAGKIAFHAIRGIGQLGMYRLLANVYYDSFDDDQFRKYMEIDSLVVKALADYFVLVEPIGHTAMKLGEAMQKKREGVSELEFWESNKYGSDEYRVGGFYEDAIYDTLVSLGDVFRVINSSENEDEQAYVIAAFTAKLAGIFGLGVPLLPEAYDIVTKIESEMKNR